MLANKDKNYVPGKINNTNNNSSKSNIRRNYPNLYYFNNNTNSYNKMDNRNQKNTRKIYSVERPNRIRNNQQIKRIINPENYLDASINNRNKNKNLSYNKNNSMIDIKNNKNFINNEYNNTYSLRKLNNNQQYSYIINDTDNLYQYYPSYNKTNGFSGNSSFSKLNYVYN